MQRNFDKAEKIVIKVGTSSVTHGGGGLNFRQLDTLARIVADLFNMGKKPVLVTSGAISAGVSALNLDERPKQITHKQAVACVGQSVLMEIYTKFFLDYGYNVGQLLLSKYVFDHPSFAQNARDSIYKLLDMRVIPIINENDSISADEIKMGDNDNLSAQVAKLIDADLLIMLSDIDGIYDKDPKKNADAKKLETITSVSKEFMDSLPSATGVGTGGIATKIQAGLFCANAGIDAIVANSKDFNIIYRIITNQNVGTYFPKVRK